jgi:hypothetical protein
LSKLESEQGGKPAGQILLSQWLNAKLILHTLKHCSMDHRIKAGM